MNVNRNIVTLDVKNDPKLKNVLNDQEDIESLERDKQYQ